ncbi:uncharacterized protein C8Q71DRAFT_903445 [Rhodofomes roseus]|uniref:F-box domain-containing protein n=1 Tax=Rhodofomes roseus TaxID=34475 RepID=A0ABQ8KTC0_9APHY|nr:uncharacterized protein C8Q71DRAFT_903445 [Rhodofomes roseus]KAH9842330.1 hypothetical protein C8Q71DRAFT_903445 [Rhodofomes roseus]
MHRSHEIPLKIQTEDDDFAYTLPPLTEEDKGQIQGMSPSGVRHWALSRISHADRYACRLRELYNSTLPVGSLPPEVLLKVFEFLQIRGLTSRWMINIVGVCRQWRATLVSSPLAWSLIDLTDGIPFVRLCLMRSKDADIHVILHDATSRSVRPSAIQAPPIKDLLAPHFHRIAQMELQPYSMISLHKASLLSMLEGPMPRLTELNLSSVFDFSSPLHLRVNCAHFPRLRTLFLDSLSVDWDGLVLPNLTTLSLRSLPRRRQPTLDAMVDILEAAPSLRKLTLFSAGPVVPTTDPPPTRRPVELNSLRTLDFNGPSAQCSALLSRISLPSDARIMLVGNALHMPDDSPVVPASTKTLAGMLPEDMYLVGPLQTFRSVWLQLWDEWFVVRADPKRSDHRNPAFRITFEAAEDRYDNFLPNALAELPLIFHQSLASLTVMSGGTNLVGREQWDRLLASFPRLLELRIASNFPVPEAFFVAMRSSTSQSPVCPELKTFAVRCDRGAEEDVEQMLRALYGCVEDRLRGGTRLSELRIATPIRSPALWEGHYAPRFGELVDIVRHNDTHSLAIDLV